VPLRDLAPRFGKVYRSRTPDRAGLFVGGERHRGLCLRVPGRAGFELDEAFSRFEVRVAVVDGAAKPVRFSILGDGKPLASTPPLFPDAKPLELTVDVTGVVLLELATDGFGGADAAFLGGRLTGAPGKDLGRFRATSAPFSASDYPSAFRRRVNEAIDGASRHLLLQQRPNGTWKARNHVPGTTALLTLALLKAGVDPDSPPIRNAFDYLRQWDYDHTYSVACLLMALEARYFPRGADPREAVKVIPDEDQVWIREAAQWLAQQQGAGFPPAKRDDHPVWRYPQGGYDLSNTQYALFGLAAADRCGARFRRVWLPALKYILAMQDAEGPPVTVARWFRQGKFYRRRTERAEARGFGYQKNSKRTGAMTSAGLCSLVLCQAALRGTRRFEQGWSRRTREGIRDALAWMEEYFDLEANPFRENAWWAYYLFNVERVGVLLDQRFIGTRDWYEEGAELLMEKQGKDGRFGNLIDTAFALLFLKRATVAPITQSRR